MALRYVNVVAGAGLVAVSAAVAHAFATGQFLVDGARLVENPWGLATLVDIYVGFVLFSCWVFWRETRIDTALSWVILLMLAGNITSTVYVLVAIHRSRGNVEKFWLGERWKERQQDEQGEQREQN